MSGDEDEQITNYFIQSAFPPEIHTQEVIKALETSHDGLSISEIQKHINLSYGQIDKVLKLLSLESPAPVAKIPKDFSVQTSTLTKLVAHDSTELQDLDSTSIPKDAYEVVLPLIINNLKIPKNAKSLAQSLDVQIGQMEAWLKRAVAEKKIIKHNKPVTYEVYPHEDLLSLLDNHV